MKLQPLLRLGRTLSAVLLALGLAGAAPGPRSWAGHEGGGHCATHVTAASGADTDAGHQDHHLVAQGDAESWQPATPDCPHCPQSECPGNSHCAAVSSAAAPADPAVVPAPATHRATSRPAADRPLSTQTAPPSPPPQSVR